MVELPFGVAQGSNAWIAFWLAIAMTVTIFTCIMLAQGLQQELKKKDAFL